MTWVKLDDGFPEHPKVAALSDAAFRAHVAGLCYAARNLTDGLIPPLIVKQLTTPRILTELKAAVWQESSDGIRIHDFLAYNPNRASVLAKRAADSVRKSSGNATESNRPVP